MNTTWTEEAIRGLGVKTDVATAASIFGISQTRAYERIKNGTFPVPVITIAGRMAVPVAPILRLLHIGTEAPGESPPAAVNPHELAALVAEKVVSRLAAAIAGAARPDDPQPGDVPPRLLKRAAGDGPEAP